MRSIFSILFLLINISINTLILASEKCNMATYRNVIAACYTGRANGNPLPRNNEFGSNGGIYTESWNYGPYNSNYKGPAFAIQGTEINSEISILPPYNWGAVGQICDTKFNPVTHQKCVNSVKQKLLNESLNAFSLSGRFYWLAHGHNCHDAAEDIAACLLNASKHMPTSCGFDARIVVWDGKPHIIQALGNIYHSQVLVKRIVEDSVSGQQDLAVCITESQSKNKSGIMSPECCTKKIDLFSGGKIKEYKEEFAKCPQLLIAGKYPHIYEVQNFRTARQTGEMDTLTSYNRDAGVDAIDSSTLYTDTAPPVPRIIDAIYDDEGNALALSIESVFSQPELSE